MIVKEYLRANRWELSSKNDVELKGQKKSEILYGNDSSFIKFTIETLSTVFSILIRKKTYLQL